MAEDGGLFSGLRFTDILFPAAATIASAYNPHIGRGLQTGMNLFNTFQDFQNSSRYYKQLKEQKDRERVGLESGQAGIDEYIAHLQGKTQALPGMMAGDPRQQDPFLDEGETSKFTLFGEEGPRLADPGNFSLHMSNLEGLQDKAEGTVGNQMTANLGIQSMANPRAAEFNTEAIVANSDTDLQRTALEDNIAYQNYMKSLMPGAFGVAAQGSSQGAFAGLSDSYRDTARKKDLLAAFEQQDRAAELGELERQAQLRQVQATSDIYSAEKQREEASRDQYAETYMKGKGPEDKLSYSEQQDAKRRMHQQFQLSQSIDATDKQKLDAQEYLVELAIDYKNRGHDDLPAAAQRALDAYLAATTGEAPDYSKTNNQSGMTQEELEAAAANAQGFMARTGLVAGGG